MLLQSSQEVAKYIFDINATTVYGALVALLCVVIYFQFRREEKLHERIEKLQQDLMDCEKNSVNSIEAEIINKIKGKDN